MFDNKNPPSQGLGYEISAWVCWLYETHCIQFWSFARWQKLLHGRSLPMLMHTKEKLNMLILQAANLLYPRCQGLYLRAFMTVLETISHWRTLYLITFWHQWHTRFFKLRWVPEGYVCKVRQNMNRQIVRTLHMQQIRSEVIWSA